MFILNIPGEPVPRREKICQRHLVDGRKKEKTLIKSIIRQQYRGPLLDTAVKVSFLFFLTIPKSVSKEKRIAMREGHIRPTKKPDCSNLQKLYEDCLTGIVIEDDRFVIDISSKKWYADQGATIIQISTIEG